MSKEKSYFKVVFIVVSVFSVSLILWNTYMFFNRLKENERIKMELLAAAHAEISRGDLESNITLALQIIQSNYTTPMILFSHEAEDYDVVNLPEEYNSNPQKIESLIARFKSQYEPIEVSYEGEVFATIYYGNSPFINKLKYYPIAIFLIILLFIGLLYFFFRTRKASEQNKLWAGMAKETAHQIGTPLSSLIGWTEILKTENVNPEYITEIEKDVSRLNTITDRFSKIGSLPMLKQGDVVQETLTSYEYLKARSSKLISFSFTAPEAPIYVNLNKQLYSWAIENLVKNAADAMKGKGHLSIHIEKEETKVNIFVVDTGCGIARKDFKTIFKPGFTTKKRGWGLGLSLTRRIIEDYHQGKIKVKNSEIGAGTTIQISLPISEL